jgi:integrase
LQRRYQYGSLTRKKRIRHEDTWEFRFYETALDGCRRRRARIIGTVAQYRTRAAALRAIESFRLGLNLEHRFARPVTVRALVDRYVEQELPQRRYGTQQGNLSTLKCWILPRWEDYLLEEVRPFAVEKWLRSLRLAPKSKVNLRGLMHVIYQCARRWELTDTNPIDLVRQEGGRRRIPRVLSSQQIHLVLDRLAEPFRTMVLVAACLGLRVSEIIGLQWGDFDRDSLTVMVQRGVVHGRVGDTKTEASRRPLPCHPYLFSRLDELRKRSPYTGPQDWVFANDSGRPRWQESILDGHLKPAAARAGIGKIGWHTFRHTYSTMLRAAGVDIKVQQELLRHATIQSTLNVYTQAISEQKRTANTQLVEMVLLNKARPTSALQGLESQRILDGSQREPVAVQLEFAQCAASD